MAGLELVSLMVGLELPLTGPGERWTDTTIRTPPSVEDTPLLRTTSVYSLSVAMDTALIMMHANQDKSLVWTSYYRTLHESGHLTNQDAQ